MARRSREVAAGAGGLGADVRVVRALVDRRIGILMWYSVENVRNMIEKKYSDISDNEKKA